MHVVQCPHCQRKFRVGRAVYDARMKCSGCGEGFTGSSTELVEAPPGAAPPAPWATAQPRAGVPSRGAYGPVVIIICCVALAGVLVLLLVFWWVRNNPKIVVTDAEGVPVPAARDPGTARRLPGGSGRRTSPPGTIPDPAGLVDDIPPDQTPAPHEPAAPPEPAGDPNLPVGEPVFASASTGGTERFACGQVRSRYAAALASVTVEARAGGQVLDSQTFSYLPAGASVRYSLRVPASVGPGDLKVLARKGEEADGDLIIWDVPQDNLSPDKRDDGTIVWTGRTRNPTGTPVKDVKVYLDFYAGDGVHGGSAQGGLRSGETIGANETGSIQVTSDALAAPDAQVWVTRVVARKY
ncbi:MAG TPA: hypothetical protein VM389_10755 [Phycisphaerae bacterium]|nr:hypothetical protein [Phycisphaerae bacterium]